MEGDKVKVTVMFRGREMVHTSRGRKQLDEVRKQLGAIAKLESAPRMEGRFMSMILVADREAVAEAKRLAESVGVEVSASEETAKAPAEKSKKEKKAVVKSVESVESVEPAEAKTEEKAEASEAAKEEPASEPEELSPAASE
jgi:translation initiation factor IF-3